MLRNFSKTVFYQIQISAGILSAINKHLTSHITSNRFQHVWYRRQSARRQSRISSRKFHWKCDSHFLFPAKFRRSSTIAIIFPSTPPRCDISIFFSFSYAIQIRQLLGGSLKNRKIDDDSKEAVRFGFLLVFSCFVVLIYSWWIRAKLGKSLAMKHFSRIREKNSYKVMNKADASLLNSFSLFCQIQSFSH